MSFNSKILSLVLLHVLPQVLDSESESTATCSAPQSFHSGTIILAEHRTLNMGTELSRLVHVFQFPNSTQQHSSPLASDTQVMPTRVSEMVVLLIE